MKIFLGALLTCLSMNTRTDVGTIVLRKYPNQVLVATGIRSGIIFGVAISLNAENGLFPEMHAIEQEDIFVKHAYKIIPGYMDCNKLQNISYKIYHKNPIYEMTDIISTIDKPITFVLASQFPDWVNPEKENYILQELDQIKQHPLKNHTILIDYIYFGTIDIDSIKNKILEINPRYKFRLEKGGHCYEEDNAVLAAYLE